MRRRFELIAYRLEQDRRNVQPGQGVVQTVAKIVNLASAIDAVRDSYQARMVEASQAPFVALLVDMLRFLVERNEDLYAGTTRPIFAGDDFQSERRLFASFIAPRGQAILFLGYVGRWGRAALRAQAQRLAEIYALMLQQLTPEQRQDMANHVRNVVMALRTLASEGKSLRDWKMINGEHMLSHNSRPSDALIGRRNLAERKMFVKYRVRSGVGGIRDHFMSFL